MAADDGTFDGFTPEAFRLLAALAKHNDRAWFAPRKERFTAELLEPMRALVVAATEGLARAKIPIGGDPSRSLFRIYRDVRFSHDKRPYKTHLSAYLSADGARDTPGGIYVHVEPGGSFVAAAYYALPPPLLTRWRTAIAEEPAAFRRAIRALERCELAIDGPEAFDDALVRMPRGFEAFGDSDVASYLRLRSYVVRRPLDDAICMSPELVTGVVRLAKDAKPFLAYGRALRT